MLGKMVTCGCVIGVVADLHCRLDVLVEAVQADESHPVVSLAIVPHRSIQVATRLVVGRQPLVEAFVFGLVDVGGEFFHLSSGLQHARHLPRVDLSRLVVRDSVLGLSGALVVLCCGVVSAAEVNAVLVRRDLQCLVELCACLVQLVEQVIPPALLIQTTRLINQTEMQRHDSQPRVDFRLLTFPECRSSGGMSQLSEALGGHVEPLCLDAHLGHRQPHGAALHPLH
mmetsp:Transcript_12318/g.29495  ORF Transcript_12318/g.29495 Transcript_12318/m.29495 type:complete len:227 (-) Transcript_12318:1043-1723(-)